MIRICGEGEDGEDGGVQGYFIDNCLKAFVLTQGEWLGAIVNRYW